MRRLVWVLASLASFLVPLAASAHAFGQQFTLALPVSYYIFGGTAAFTVSAAIILLFSEPYGAPIAGAHLRAWKHPGRTCRIFATIGIIALLMELLFAFAGGPDYFSNPAIVLFWIYLLLGFTYFSVIMGGVWELVNPFHTLARLFAPHESVRYPAWLSYWPAIILFFGLIELELYSGGSASEPLVLGFTLLIYLAVMLGGAAIYGAEAWLAHADIFGIFFRTVSLFAPIRLTSAGIERDVPGARLVREKPKEVSLVFFILFMLSSTAFDGLHETRAWWGVVEWIHTLGLPFMPGIVGTVGLALSPFVFFGLYACALMLTKALVRSGTSLTQYLLRFGYSLVPIMIAYHFAHYFTLLISEGQRLFYQISDPFGTGRDLFGTAGYTPNFVPLGSDTVWYIQLGVIVAGHIIAAFLAHRIAVREYKSAGKVILSQLPMLVLMVGYTALGLWILSRPFAV